MATKPGLFTDWPWQKLGKFKYVILAPWVARSIYRYMEGSMDMGELYIIPALLVRAIHNQIWISLSRFQNARSKHRIVNKSIEFDQVDRERNWDDQILLNGLIFYVGLMYIPQALNLPMWRTEGAVMMALIHMGPVEFLYYWLHRALHHHFLYSRYHSHHHSSIVTEPITSVIHPFLEHVFYFILFAIPMLVTIFKGSCSVLALLGYLSYIDFMNNMGHCNFELVPMRLFHLFPPLKYLMYTPSFHSLHHTQFRTNYSLFMPFYDYIYNTMDESTDDLYERSIQGKVEMVDAVYLTHLVTPQSVFHLRLGFAGLASRPYVIEWYLWMVWPVTWVSMLVTSLIRSTFVVERNGLKKLLMQTWVIPRYSLQYMSKGQREGINGLIEEAILEAEEKGIKVITLGLLNKGEELNGNGELYLQKHPKLKIRIVDGSSLAVAVVVNSIPHGTKQVLLRGKITKTAYGVALALCQKGVHVLTISRDEFEVLKLRLPAEMCNNVTLTNDYSTKVWIVGEGLTNEEQGLAPSGTIFIPFSQFPLYAARKDCTYYSTPAMVVPKDLENVHSCENWLPRRVMSAWRVAGVVHALEGWDAHECGEQMLEVDKVWRAALSHGFSPMV
ncbi:Protein ECERIFERUM 1 [Acorus calamus]|uniref:aldehyde oxygenase (deformylating) n=1 Tax=Acorus calamus TaxID=4465 RepID=A0AAV9CPN1_ACOCL|nr:Protein ECERIFERUM 1 [Acorus calamus]